MVNVTLDRALPLVRKLAERKANAFVRRCGWPIHEREDVQSHLITAFIKRWPRYDCTKSSAQTFASRLMDKELLSILRYHRAQRRQQRDPRAPSYRPTPASLQHFRLDVSTAIGTLPDVIQVTAHALSRYSPTDAARAVGCSRQTINKRRGQIRDALQSAGIGPNYFGRGA